VINRLFIRIYIIIIRFFIEVLFIIIIYNGFREIVIFWLLVTHSFSPFLIRVNILC